MQYKLTQSRGIPPPDSTNPPNTMLSTYLSCSIAVSYSVREGELKNLSRLDQDGVWELYSMKHSCCELLEAYVKRLVWVEVGRSQCLEVDMHHEKLLAAFPPLYKITTNYKVL